MHRIENLDYDKNLFIFGETVNTKFGSIRFLTYREYLSHAAEINLIAQNSLHIYYNYRNQLKEAMADESSLKALMEIKEADLLEIVLSTRQLLNAYLKIFQLVFDGNEEKQYEIIFESSESFHFVRRLIMDMNVITEDKVSPNEEIQRAIERSRRFKQQSSQEQTFVDIVTSIVASTSNSFDDVCRMNIFQVYAIYARVGAIYNYQTSTLFATVAEKVNIESWNKHIDLFKLEDDVISKNEFDKKFGGLLQM
ncbi:MULTISPECIES: hypothetical protein [unclassified Lysinibacillus]|uniref:hypothetical protein n=1 Tax=unclassified Lysinibacillus TaxID=2636778 RepID=UPI003829FECD